MTPQQKQAEERAKENYMKFPDSPDYNSIVDTKMSGFIRGYLDCYEVNKLNQKDAQIAKLRDTLKLYDISNKGKDSLLKEVEEALEIARDLLVESAPPIAPPIKIDHQYLDENCEEGGKWWKIKQTLSKLKER